MVDLEELERRAQRTAERSRWRMALRVTTLVAPLVALASVTGGDTLTCICLGGALLVLTVGLRWRDRLGAEAVRTGLLLGMIPTLAAMTVAACGFECQLGALSEAEIGCLAGGAIAGVGATLTARRARPRWLLTLFVASATAALGCAGLGTAGIAITLLGVVTASAMAWTIASWTW